MAEQTKQTEVKPESGSQANLKKDPVSGDIAGRSRTVKGLLRGTKIAFILTIVVALIAAGWQGWADWQQRNIESRDTQALLTSLQQSIHRLDRQYQQGLQAQNLQSRQMDQLQQAIYDVQLRANSQGKRLTELGSSTRSDWLLAEVIYLSRLAHQRLQTERSSKTALALLESVDIILKQLDDPDLFAVRSALTADITALRLAAEVDVEGIYMQLTSLSHHIDQLPLIERSTRAIPQIDSLDAADNPPSQRTEGLIADFVHRLGQLIRISHRHSPIEPLLLPTEEAVVRHNLRLMIEQAQIALLQERQIIYRQSLERAQNWLQVYFYQGAEAVSQQLTAVAEQTIIQPLPAINKSLEAIETFVRVRQQRLTEVDDSAEQEKRK